MGKPKGAHHKGTYHVRSKAVRDAANANPNTVCWRCGQPAKAGDPWTAGHIRDSDPTSPLAPEHASCNYSAGARAGNAKRQTLPPSRRW